MCQILYFIRTIRIVIKLTAKCLNFDARFSSLTYTLPYLKLDG